MPGEHSALPQRGREAKGAEIGFHLCRLCTFAPLRQTEHRQAGNTINEFYKSLYARDEAQ